MATAYNFIAANKRRSGLLLLTFIAFFGFIGWALSARENDGGALLVLAIIFGVFSALTGYFGGDKIALHSSGAHGPLKKADAPELYNQIENLCIASGMPMPKVYLIEDPGMNAFATGRDPQHASIAVTTGLIQGLENEELEGVLAHELSHIKNYDIRYMTLVVALVGALTILADMFWHSRWTSSSDNNNRGSNPLAIIGVVLLVLSPLIGQLVQLAVSRRREFLADASGALLTRYPEGLARALEKISTGGSGKLRHANQAIAPLFISNPFGSRGTKTALFSTHPPIAERVKALRSMDHMTS